MELIRKGSAKDILRCDQETIAFRFTPYFSVFDVGRNDYKIPGKTEAMCACAVKSFEIAETIGVPTHFMEQIDPVTIRVRESQIITDRALTSRDENHLVPLEWIYRLRVAGSIYRDFRSGKKKPENYGLPANIIPEEGAPFPWPVHMITTKFEEGTDRELSDEEACHMAGITVQDRDQYWSMIDRLTGAIALVLAGAGFALLDGKMECIMGPGRQKMIGDVFGTPDEDRPCLAAELEEGEVIHYSKEYIRQLFIEMGYYDKLKKAREAGQPDPPIPRLQPEEIEEASNRYIVFAQSYTDKRLEIPG